MLIDIARQPSPRQLRLFAGLFFPAFCAIAGALAYQRDATLLASALWVLGFGGGALGLLLPSVSRATYCGLAWLTFPLGWLLSHVILVLLYFVVVTPVGWLMRRFHDPIERRFERDARSYWTPRQQPRPDRYFRQF